MNEISKVPIPERMQHLPTDKRGYPIPFIVLRDEEGNPFFTANNAWAQRQCTLMGICPICGEILTQEDLWLVGGPLSAFHPAGFYHDSAMHYTCMNYALRVCPYLALPNYLSKSRVNNPQIEKRIKIRFVDPTQDPTRPEIFVAVQTRKIFLAYNNPPHGLFKIGPERPFALVEFWKHGERFETLAALRTLRLLCEKPDSELRWADVLKAIAGIPEIRRENNRFR